MTQPTPDVRRPIVSQYPVTCQACGEQFYAGTQVVKMDRLIRVRSGWGHVSCATTTTEIIARAPDWNDIRREHEQALEYQKAAVLTAWQSPDVRVGESARNARGDVVTAYTIPRPIGVEDRDLYQLLNQVVRPLLNKGALIHAIIAGTALDDSPVVGFMVTVPSEW